MMLANTVPLLTLDCAYGALSDLAPYIMAYDLIASHMEDKEHSILEAWNTLLEWVRERQSQREL